MAWYQKPMVPRRPHLMPTSDHHHFNSLMHVRSRGKDATIVGLVMRLDVEVKVHPDNRMDSLLD